jgi:hypothetical protein
MTRIVFRILVLLLILVGALITFASMITGVNIWEKYSKQIMLITALFCGMVMAFYVAVALLGLN